MKNKISNIISENSLIIKQIIYEDCGLDLLDLSIFNQEEHLKFESFISKKRKLEFYFTRLLLQSFNLNSSIQYGPNGKPFIEEGHISLTHSKNIILIAFSRTDEIGVDIEFYKEKIHRIKHKFLSSYELKKFNCENTEILTLIWSIKEAIYKIEDIPGLRFREDMSVQSIEDPGHIAIYKNGESHNYVFNYLKYTDYIITYCHLISIQSGD